ncbi:MAG: helix-turn-helix domain-containing protein [Pseudomonadota bacterium]|nr:helix-turn-helix domain-containing protein [Pseudomonadota bacterium]
MTQSTVQVVDARKAPRHGIVWAEDWDSDRFRLLSTAQRVVYVTLVMYATAGRGEVWPKQGTIASVTGLSRRAVEDAIRRLAELGYVRIARKATGLRRRNTYTLLSPPREPPP